ncbi:MAG: hypothetical protein OHK0022_59000 [Roseiflexaceae bacterium]
MLRTLRASRAFQALLPYLVAGGAVVAALLLSLLAMPLVAPNPFLLFFAAVALVAWYGGFGPSLCAIVLAVICAGVFLIPPEGVFPTTPGELARMAGFMLVAGLISGLSELRRRAVQRADDQTERLVVTLRSIGDAVITADTQGCVTMLNPVAEALTGWRSADALGMPLATVFHIIDEDTRQLAESPAVRVLREGVVVGLANHTLLVARDGSSRPIDDSGAPIRDAKGQIIGVVLVFRDVTERRRAEIERERLVEQIRQAQLRAEAAVHLRDQFLSVASHELKTPLTSLLMQTQLVQRRALREGSLSERDQRALQMITGQVHRLDRMINAMLDISRLELGQLSIVSTPVDLDSLAQRVISEIQPTTEQHMISYHGPAGALVVGGDDLRLEQVLQNLIQNAIKYSPDGGEISVRVDGDSRVARISVSDSGIGIPTEALSQLFTRFYRAANADPRQISGMGIGLYVVKEIVTLHGGTISVSSNEGEGSTFTIELPLEHQPDQTSQTA